MRVEESLVAEVYADSDSKSENVCALIWEEPLLNPIGK